MSESHLVIHVWLITGSMVLIPPIRADYMSLYLTRSFGLRPFNLFRFDHNQEKYIRADEFWRGH